MLSTTGGNKRIYLSNYLQECNLPGAGCWLVIYFETQRIYNPQHWRSLLCVGH